MKKGKNIQEIKRKTVWSLEQDEIGVEVGARIGRALYTMLMILVTVLGTIGRQLNEKGTKLPCPPQSQGESCQMQRKTNKKLS